MVSSYVHIFILIFITDDPSCFHLDLKIVKLAKITHSKFRKNRNGFRRLKTENNYCIEHFLACVLLSNTHRMVQFASSYMQDM